ncbi:MAG: hypothetical protein M3Y53_03095 [Thermoproteota archaeon]|nr:hypothetical protein [Thermoproteota archaeon]
MMLLAAIPSVIAATIFINQTYILHLPKMGFKCNNNHNRNPIQWEENKALDKSAIEGDNNNSCSLFPVATISLFEPNSIVHCCGISE